MDGEPRNGQRPLDVLPLLNRIEQLQVSRRARDKHGQFFVEGVRIPMLPGTDSLNLGVAGSLLLYEVFRSQRRRS